jgi:polyisoprenoid-binding protein YceI
MKRTLLVILATLLIGSTINNVNAELVDYNISSGEVVFISKSTLETFEGKTDQISGHFSFDPSDPGSILSGEITVDMTTLKTGRKKRDKHMYKNHLHVEEFPTSVFTADNIVELKSSDGDALNLSISGIFKLHGVENEITPEINAKWIVPGEELDVTATFKVKLPDYDIPRPSFLVMKVAEEQEIEVKFRAKR